MESPRLLKLREVLEIVFIVGVAYGILTLHQMSFVSAPTLIWVVVGVAMFKTGYYFCESLWHLLEAAALDLPYHRFLILMAYNMTEVTLSFAIDFYCLSRLDQASISGIDPSLTGFSLLFECFYFSVLNFSFFGYGDITPAYMAAKMVMLMEVITAFSTVIFLLSDFVSMKDSMRKSRRDKMASQSPANVEVDSRPADGQNHGG